MSVRENGLALILGVILLTVLFAPLVYAQEYVGVLAPQTQPDVNTAGPDYMRYIHVNDLVFDPLVKLPTIPSALRYESLQSDLQGYYVVQFSGPVKDSMKKSLESTGAKILYYISYNAFVVRADGHALDLVNGLSTVRWTGVFEPAYKISPTLSERYDDIIRRADDSSALTNSGGAQLSYASSIGAKLGDSTAGQSGLEYSPSHLYVAPSDSVTHMPTKLSKDSGSFQSTPSTIQIELVTFESSGVYSATGAVKALGAQDVIFSDGAQGKVRATITRNLIPEIAKIPEVMWIERFVQPVLDNDITRWVIQSGDGTTYATPIHDHGIYGTNQTVTVCDSGIDWRHDAFQDSVNISPSHRKITDYYTPPGAYGDYTDNGINHGTHVSGTVAGDDGIWHVYDGDPLGASGTAGPHDGQAFDAKVQMQDISDDGYYVYPPSDYHVMYQEALNRGSYIHTNSWGGPEYDYVSECAATDDFIWDNQDMIVLFSAGNPGSGLGWISSYAGSKNVIGVGAGENGPNRNEIASFSGRGPTADGRLKPDVIAPGVNIWSAHGGAPGYEYDDYFQLSGTSMSTPGVAGAAALVRQYYMDGWYPTGAKQPLNGFVPSAALVKATIINSAVEMTGSTAYMNGEYRYPNYNQGWGRVTLDEALYFSGDAKALSMHDERVGLSTSASDSYMLAIGDVSVPVEITLVWSDYPGVPYSSPELVNDLDLVVTAPDGTTYRGNQYAGYNPGSSVPNALGRDHLNNTECVLVLAPSSGMWTVQVIGFNIPYGPQPYALVMTGGIATEMGSVSLDRSVYQSSAVVKMTLVDTDLDLDPNATDMANVSIWSATESTPENVLMTETGNSTSVFAGSISLDSSAVPVGGDGFLQVQNRDDITVAYFDANNGLNGSGYVYDYAVVDDDPPAIWNVRISEMRFNRATVTWSTDETSNSTVDWGDSIPPVNSKSDLRNVLNHSVSLSGLTENTTYYFAVASSDEAGNLAYDDNGSAYYVFTTPARPPIQPPSHDWPTYHNNPSRQGVSPSVFEPPLELMWTDGPNFESYWTSPVFANGILYTTTLDGYLRAREAYTGALIWERPLGGQYYYTCSPVVEDGIVYVSFTYDDNYTEMTSLFALDALTGATIWETGMETGMFMSARVALLGQDGLLFGYSWSGEIWSIDMVDGSVEWTYNAGEYGLAGGTAGEGAVFFTLRDSNSIVALDEFSGSEMWSYTLDNFGVGPPLYAQGCVYIGSESGTMYCLDAGSGAVVWQKSGLGQIDYGTPAYDGATIYFGTYSGSYFALDANDGTQLWSVSATGPIGSSVVYADGYIYGTSIEGYLCVYDAYNGTLVDSHMLKDTSISSAAASEGWIWCEDLSGNVYAFMGLVPVGIIISPGSNSSSAVPDSSVDYWIRVNNSGISGPDTFDIVATPGALGWPVDLLESDGSTPLGDSDSDGLPDTGELASRETTDIIVRVGVPAGASVYDDEMTLVTFTSSKNLNVSKTAKLETIVPGPGVEIGPNAYFPAAPGSLAVTSMVVKNTGALADTIDLSASSSNVWQTWLFEADGTTPLGDSDSDGVPDTGTIPGLGTYDIVVQVLVPSTATIGTTDKVTVTGTSSVDINASGSARIVIELAPEPNDDWPTFHNDNARRGCSPSAFTPPLTDEWTYYTGTYSYYESPVMADNMVFMPMQDGVIRALDSRTGSLVWSRTLGMNYYSSNIPVVADGMVYVTFYTGAYVTIFALDEFTGDTVWTLDQTSGIYVMQWSVPAVADGTYFGIADSGQLFAADAKTGDIDWVVDAGYYLALGLAIGGGMVFVADQIMNTVSAFNQMTGSLIWTALLTSWGTYAPLYAQGNVYLATAEGTMYCIDSISGEIIWSTDNLGQMYRSTPAFDDSTLYIGTDDSVYYALDASDGTILWTRPAHDWMETSCAVANGYVYGVDYSGWLMVLDGSTGGVVQEIYLGTSSHCTPAISNGWIWVSDYYGRVHAFSGEMPVGLDIEPVADGLEVAPPSVVEYDIRVTNLGSLPSDVFDVVLTPGATGWATELLHSDRVTPLSDTDSDGVVDTGTMVSQSAMTIVLRLTVPDTANGGDFETDHVKFTSSNDVNISKTATRITIVPPPGVTIGPDAYSSARAGDVVNATMTVQNDGGLPDTVDVDASSCSGWNISLFGSDGATPLTDTDSDGLVDVGELSGFEQIDIIVRVEVPSDATEGSLDTATVTAISSLDPGQTDEARYVVELAPPANVEWPTYMNNEARHGRSPSFFMPPLEYVWGAYSPQGTDWTTPIVDNGIVFTTHTDGYIRARDRITGSLFWEDQLGSPGQYAGNPTTYEGRIFVTFNADNTTGTLYAIDEFDGSVIWSNSTMGFDEYAYMASANGMIFTTTYSGCIVALDADTGELLWSYSTGNWVYGGPTAASGMVVAVGESGNIYALDQMSGSLLWSKSIGTIAWSAPMIARGTVYVGTYYGGGLYALDVVTGDTRWMVSGLNVDSATPAYDGEHVYVGAGNRFYAFDAETGEQIWSTLASSYGSIAASMAYADGYLVGTSTDGTMYVLDASDGQIIESWGIGYTTSSPSIVNGWVYVQNSYGSLYALRGQLPYGVQVSPKVQQDTGLPGSYATYSVTVTNTGTLGVDVFDGTAIEGALGWDVDLFESDGVTPLADTDSDGLPDTGPLEPTEQAFVVVKVWVPSAFNLSDQESSTVVFTSSMDPAVSDYAILLTELPPAGCSIEPRYYLNPNPGDTVTAAMDVVNAGPLPDTFDLTMASMAGWTAAIYEQDGVTPISDHDSDGVPDTGVLMSGESYPIVVEVLVPSDALPGDIEVTWISGTSNLDPTAVGSAPVIMELGVTVDREWPTSHHDNPRSGVNPMSYELPLRELWRSFDDDMYPCSWYGPVVHDDMTIVTKGGGTIAAYDIMTGELVWEKQYGSDYDWAIPGGIAAAYGYLYSVFETQGTTGNTEALIYCLDEATGEPVWSYTTSTPYGAYTYTAPAVAAGMVFWCDWNGCHVWANDAFTGDVLWSYDIPNVGYVDGGPTYWGGMVFIEDDVGQVSAIDAFTGDLIWMVSTSDSFTSAVTVVDGIVYALGGWEGLHAFDAFTGEVLWETGELEGSSNYQSAVVVNDVAYFGVIEYSGNGSTRFYAVDTITGFPIWTTMLSDAPLWESFAYCNGALFVGCDDGILYVIDAETGEILQMLEVEPWNWVSSVAIGDGVVVIGTGNGTVVGYAFSGVGEPTNLAVTPDSATLDVTGSAAFDAAVTDAYGYQLDGYEITWTMENGLGTIVPTDDLGESIVFVAGPVAGTEVLHATYGNLTATVTIDILAGDTYTVVVQPGDAYVVATETLQFTATALDRWGNEIQEATFTWDASPSIGIIDGTGLLTAGTATAAGSVTATYAGVTGVAEVEIGPGPLVSLSATPASITDVVGSTTIVQAAGYDQYGNEIPGLTFTWSTDIGTIALASETTAAFSAGTLSGYGNITLTCGIHEIEVPVHVVPGVLHQILLTPADVQLTPGQVQTFVATPVDIYGNVISGLTLTWSASASIGTITQGGVLTAGTSVGTGTVTVSSGLVSSEATAKVVPGPLDHIVVTPTSLSITAGSATTLSAVGYDAYGNALSGLTFLWSATGGAVTAVGDSSNGQYSAPTAAGSATITVTSGSVSTPVSVTVNPGPLAAVSISPATATITAGGSQMFTATGTDVFGNVLSGLTFTWSASASAGTISQTGILAAATTVGSGTVTVTCGAFTATADVDLVPGALASIVLSPSPIATVAGQKVVIIAVGLDLNENEIPGLTFAWSATAGAVTAATTDWSTVEYVAPTTVGWANVTATVGAVSETVQVMIGPGPIASLMITPWTANVTAGGSMSFSAWAMDVYGNTISGATITWATTAGTISAAGSLTAPTTAGAVVVTATSGSVEAEANVNIVPGALDSIVVNPSALDLKTGGGANIVVKAYDQYGNEIEGLEMTWSTTIGTVDVSEDGYSAAFGAGEHTGKGTITVACGDETEVVTVDVSSGSIPLGRQLAQPMSLLFIAIAVILALLLLLLFLKGRKAAGAEAGSEAPAEDTQGTGPQ